MRDDQRQRLLSGGCGEQLSWAEPASSYPEQNGALTHGFRLSPADPDRSRSQRQDPPGVVDRSVTYARTMGGIELDRYYFHSFEHWPGVPAASQAATADADVPALAERLGLRNEYGSAGDAPPPQSIAYLRRVSAIPGQITDTGLLGAEAIVHVAAMTPEPITEFRAGLARLLGPAVTPRVLAGVVRPLSYTGQAPPGTAGAPPPGPGSSADLPQGCRTTASESLERRAGWSFREVRVAILRDGQGAQDAKESRDFDRDGVPADPEVGACVDGGRMCGEVLADGHGEGVVQVRGDIHLGDTARHRPGPGRRRLRRRNHAEPVGRGQQRAGRV